MLRYESRIKKSDFNVHIEKCLTLLKKAHKIHNDNMYIEAVNNYKGHSQSNIVKQFKFYIREATKHLLYAGEALDRYDDIEEYVYMKNQLLLARIHLIGNTNLVTSKYIKSSHHSGENARSILLEFLQSRKLNDDEILAVNIAVSGLVDSILSFNDKVDYLFKLYPEKYEKGFKISLGSEKKRILLLKKIK